jgi:UTP:GlnB (protein PII) uridylyltransferase
MSSRNVVQDEMARAERLPQADASSLVDAQELEAKVREMYGQVARGEDAELHFEVGRDLAERLGYPPEHDYDFISDRALDACSTYEVQSVSLAAVKTA